MPCLTPECQSEDVYSRGLCRKCYDRFKKRVRRGTLKWNDLIDQGLAKRASRVGPSFEVRSAAQKVRKSRGNPRGLSDSEYKHFLSQYKRGYNKIPGDMSQEQLKKYEELLGLTGPDDPSLAGDSYDS
jgi:hypothetical protein